MYKRQVIGRPDVIYIRDQRLLHIVCRIKERIPWIFQGEIVSEVHELYSDLLPGNRGVAEREGFNFQVSDKIVAMTGQFKNILVKKGVNPNKILVAHDGVDLDMFRPIEKKIARKAIGVPENKKLVVYSGHLDEWRGVYTLALAMKDVNAELVVVGGLPMDREKFMEFIKKEDIKNVNMVGMVDIKDVAKYISAGDVAVLPNSGKYPVSKYYVSPLKLFEYMACKVPIVASDLPNLREILEHRKTAFLVEPDDPDSLSKGIIALLSNRGLAEKISGNAYKLVQKYTWYNRAKKVIKFLSN